MINCACKGMIDGFWPIKEKIYFFKKFLFRYRKNQLFENKKPVKKFDHTFVLINRNYKLLCC